jgi:hypothetical protein
MRELKSYSPPKNDLTGREFGQLVVLHWLSRERASDGTLGPLKWLCKCICGNTKEVTTGDLVNHRVRSCGCMAKARPTKKYYNERLEGCPFPCKSCMDQWTTGKCCRECEEEKTCNHACLNHPDKCGRKKAEVE